VADICHISEQRSYLAAPLRGLAGSNRVRPFALDVAENLATGANNPLSGFRPLHENGRLVELTAWHARCSLIGSAFALEGAWL